MAEKTDVPYFEEPSRAIQLRVWVLGQMIWGAFLAAVFVIGIVLTLFIIYWLGLLLPEQSKQAPSPFGQIELALPAASKVA
jgi:photosynthetic reaction center PufX protein